MNFKDEIDNFILYDRKRIFEKISELKIKLELDKKLNSKIDFIDDIDFIYVRNLDMEQSIEDIRKQMINNKDKKLELECVINGKKNYLKGFGKIENISKDVLLDIYKFITLIKLSKRISETSYYASQYYRSEIIFEELFKKISLDF